MKKSIIFKILCIALSAITVCLCLSACGDKDIAIIGGADGPTKIIVGEITHTDKVRFDIDCGGKDIGSFTMMLYPEYAPITVANFVGLVQEGFYDGVTFHRIAEGGYGPFVAQGGDPNGDGRTNPGQKQIKGEFAANGVDNPLADSHVRGVVSMARTNDYNSASSQFFICYNDNYGASLDGQYAAFGKVIEGMEVVDSFLEVERDANDKPLTDIIITKAEIIEN